MERGEATPAATIHEKEEIVLMQGPVVTEKPVKDGDEASGSTPMTSTRVSYGGETGPTETGREGSPILAEWREGPHQVIERRTGPGEEVRVCLSQYASGDTDGFVFNAGRG